ncbi:Phosphoserine phosphatase 1 [Microbacterium hydrocarbonoxydans]|uniref:Phosphoserine phosphatase 1 n=1 Tax=Microbacterium hydrocarbonoxydans TaxID=273678 RepID=A0A0M2HHA8_9MICO|nr:histidine phosphatase family protein [Microbacterium hydrocarbonoxydans]KJL46130.1 Phosphoserine phosphatase 1 [Microbacterium hydrocarbonoxydans]
MRLLLIRHGQTPSNVVGALDTGRPGPGLTALGQTQAEAIPGALAEEAIDAIYASPLVRTQLTAAPLAAARGLDAEVLEGFEEIAAGRWEMRNDMEAVRAYMETASRWAVGDLDATIEGGESGHEFFARYDNAIAKVAAANPAATAVVVSHGAAIRVWAAARIAGVDLSEAAKWRIYNTGMCALDGDPQNGWELVRWVREPLGGVELEDARALDVDPPMLRSGR